MFLSPKEKVFHSLTHAPLTLVFPVSSTRFEKQKTALWIVTPFSNAKILPLKTDLRRQAKVTPSYSKDGDPLNPTSMIPYRLYLGGYIECRFQTFVISNHFLFSSPSPIS